MGGNKIELPINTMDCFLVCPSTGGDGKHVHLRIEDIYRLGSHPINLTLDLDWEGSELQLNSAFQQLAHDVFRELKSKYSTK